MIMFWGKLKQKKGIRIKEKFELTSIGFAALSNECWCLANKFTNFTAEMMEDAIADTISS